MRAIKRYMLDDGQTVTAGDVAKKVGITISSALYRLRKSSDPQVVFRPPATKACIPFERDGLTYTTTQIMKITGLKRSSARRRLMQWQNYTISTEKLVSPPQLQALQTKKRASGAHDRPRPGNLANIPGPTPYERELLRSSAKTPYETYMER